MKRFSLREFLLLCTPISLISVVLLVARVLNPPRDLNAVVKLVVRQIPSNYGLNRKSARLQFAWQADATGGPQNSYCLVFHEEIVAIGPKSETVIYANPFLSGSGHAELSGASEGSTPGQAGIWTHDLQLDDKSIPLNAKRFEWRGDFAAVPQPQGSSSFAATSFTIAHWASVFKGATRVKKVISIRFDAAQHAISKFTLGTVNATNVSKGFDTCITVDTVMRNRSVCRRLVAFDGKRRRLVWQENVPSYLPWSEEAQYGDVSSRSNLLLKLRGVPQSWGEISFLYDVVFEAKSSGLREEKVDMKTLEALQRAGGIRFSRRLLVRRANQIIAAPKYQRAPNLRLLRVQTRPLGSRTQILITLEYLAGQPDPEVEITGGVDFFDSKGKWLDIAEVVGVKRGAKPKEWVLTLETKNHGPKLACRMQAEIGDGAAAPLKVTQKLVLP